MKRLKFITFISQNNTGYTLHQRTGVAFALAVEKKMTQVCCAFFRVLSLHCAQTKKFRILSFHCAPTSLYILHCAQLFHQISCSDHFLTAQWESNQALVWYFVKNINIFRKVDPDSAPFEVPPRELGTRNNQCCNPKKNFFWVKS